MKSLFKIALIAGVVLTAIPVEAKTISITNIDNFPSVVDFYGKIDHDPQPTVPHWDKAGIELLTQVNDYYNGAIVYQNHHDGKNYYQSPQQTISSGKGNCEDYATIKWWALINNGIDPHDMYFYSGIHDFYGTDHTVLAVNLNNHFYYLDNTTKDLNILTIKNDASWMINRYGVLIYIDDVK